mmetsp:Transcript_23632/g.20691  ORF Transcript_23632/g.20691 Transcript_23632/m.20691 type:complete len:211 (+) Transcript_23632:206-838(+)
MHLQIPGNLSLSYQRPNYEMYPFSQILSYIFLVAILEIVQNHLQSSQGLIYSYVCVHIGYKQLVAFLSHLLKILLSISFLLQLLCYMPNSFLLLHSLQRLSYYPQFAQISSSYPYLLYLQWLAFVLFFFNVFRAFLTLLTSAVNFLFSRRNFIFNVRYLSTSFFKAIDILNLNDEYADIINPIIPHRINAVSGSIKNQGINIIANIKHNT